MLEILGTGGVEMLLQRTEYLDRLIAFRDKQLIKIVTGIRRCGKSTLLELYQDWLKQQGVEERQIISINFEDIDYEELTDYKRLYSYLKERLIPGKMTYVFLDEIQHVKDFPRAVDSLFIKKNVDLYLTGSNAYMLSSEIATLISGRYVQIEMLPLSFREYMESTGSMEDRSTKYVEYLENSSFPYALELKGRPNELRDYLEGIYNTILVKDIVSRKKITDTMMLKSILRFVFDNIGSPLSSKKIADTMTSDGRKIDAKTVERYLEALSESYIIYQAKRYNIKGKQYLKTLEKYYVVDIGLRFMLLGSRQADAGHILENVVYLELLRRGYDVSVGKVDEYEVDFVAQNSRGTTYFQVALSVRNEQTLERELRPLMMIRDHYPKFILTLDDDPEAQYDGIRRVNARDWLLGLTD
jgi:predicted AAA+ superfamily ATPase